MKVRTPDGRIGWVVSMYTNAKRAGTTTKGTYNSYKPSTRPNNTSKSRTTRSFTGGSMVTAGVRVHATPALRGQVIGLAAAGTHVQIIGHSGSWVLVRLPNGRTGYIYGIYVH
jgi:SH3-like domain-containing protein